MSLERGECRRGFAEAQREGTWAPLYVTRDSRYGMCIVPGDLSSQSTDRAKWTGRSGAKVVTQHRNYIRAPMFIQPRVFRWTLPVHQKMYTPTAVNVSVYGCSGSSQKSVPEVWSGRLVASQMMAGCSGRWGGSNPDETWSSGPKRLGIVARRFKEAQTGKVADS